MWRFLIDFFHEARQSRTLIIFDEDELQPPRRHQVRPADVGGVLFGVVVLGVVLLVLLLGFTPLRSMIPGVDSSETAREVRVSLLRLQAMQDSLEVQQQYLSHLRQVMIGSVDSVTMTTGQQVDSQPVRTDVDEVASEGRSADWSDHEQPALSYWRFSSIPAAAPYGVAIDERSITNLQLPVLPPVSGFLTRGFDARAGHFGVDFAAEEGSTVRSVGNGYVIFADWSHEGGYTIAIQHSDGYVSIYKHNRRLLKRTGERVRAREAIAESGNSGEMTTGPHLHFEFWHNGLAQDPRLYFVTE